MTLSTVSPRTQLVAASTEGQRADPELLPLVEEASAADARLQSAIQEDDRGPEGRSMNERSDPAPSGHTMSTARVLVVHAVLALLIGGSAGVYWKYLDAKEQEGIAKTNEENSKTNEAEAKKQTKIAKKNEAAHFADRGIGKFH